MKKQNIQPFLTVANYHLIEQQMNKILSALATSNDKNIIQTIRGLVDTKITTNITLSTNETKLIERLFSITDRAQGEAYLESLKPFVIPFKSLTASTIKSLFKKEKKLKLPALEQLDFQHICYLAWDDLGTHRKYVIIEQDGKLIGIKGTFDHGTIKGICAICNRHADVGAFTTSIKGKVPGTFTSHTNYICADSQQCNHHVTDINQTIAFFNRIKQK